MIRHTFSILNGIGQKLEKKLWQRHILTWSDFLKTPELSFISTHKKYLCDWKLSVAKKELNRENAFYFACTLKRGDHWRLFDVFRHDAVYLDIETNGFMPESGGYPTIVGIFDGLDYHCLVHGEDLHTDNITRLLSGYKYIVTFYGTAFDIPFLMRSMPGLQFNIPHFDLCFGARKLGLRGGLKRLEEEFSIQRDDTVKGLDGYDAVKLWSHAKQGSNGALELLKQYNREDTVNLFSMADTLYKRLKAQTGIEEYL